MHWFKMLKMSGIRCHRDSFEIWVYLPLGMFEGRNKRLEYLDYTIGRHYKYLLFTLWYRPRGQYYSPAAEGWHCAWQVKLYPVPGKSHAEEDDSYLELQDRA